MTNKQPVSGDAMALIRGSRKPSVPTNHDAERRLWLWVAGIALLYTLAACGAGMALGAAWAEVWH